MVRHHPLVMSSSTVVGLFRVVLGTHKSKGKNCSLRKEDERQRTKEMGACVIHKTQSLGVLGLMWASEGCSAQIFSNIRMFSL